MKKKTMYPDCHICPLGECVIYYGYLCKNRDCKMSDKRKQLKANRLDREEERYMSEKGFYAWLDRHEKIKNLWLKCYWMKGC